jgi:hypothetical protein
MAPDVNFDDLDNEDSFADKIGESFKRSNFHAPIQSYLPEPCVCKLITEQSIETELNKFEGVLAAKLQRDDKGRYTQFGQYDRIFRKELAHWIYLAAQKIFIIAVQCELDAFKLVLAMSLFQKNEFGDKKLPVRDFPMPGIFSPKVWSATQLHNFFDKQWRLLVPVFSPTRYEYDLDAECIFPFELLRTMHKAGAFSSVYRVRIHEGHQLHKNLGDVSEYHSKVHSTY